MKRRDFLRNAAFGLCAGVAGVPWAGLKLSPWSGLAFAARNAPFSVPLPTPSAGGALFGFATPEGPVELVAAASGLAPQPNIAAPVWSYQLASGDRVIHNPIFRLKQGDKLQLAFRNALPEQSIIHWHGLDADASQTGQPRYAVGPQGRYEYAFSISNRGGTYWYHPHPHGLTAKQTYLGLASFFLVEDEDERRLSSALGLELGVTDIPLLLQDKRLDGQGRLVYAPSAEEMIMGYQGDAICVNGAVQPYLEIGSRPYRFRILNGSTARLYRLGFVRNGAPQPCQLLGVDGGLLDAARTLSEFFLSPGERVDLLLDCSDLAVGDELVLRNLPFDPMHREEMGVSPAAPAGHGEHGAHGAEHGAPAPSAHAGHAENAGGVGEGADYPILALRVRQRVDEKRVLPETLSALPAAPAPGKADRTFTLGFHAKSGQWRINGLTFAMDAVPIQILSRRLEIWEFRNDAASMPHPMHTHGYPFRVLQRKNSPRQVRELAVAEGGLSANDLGVKDTVLVWPKETVQVAIDFRTPAYAGEQIFLLHCHNLEHEDRGMMLNFRVAS